MDSTQTENRPLRGNSSFSSLSISSRGFLSFTKNRKTDPSKAKSNGSPLAEPVQKVAPTAQRNAKRSIRDSIVMRGAAKQTNIQRRPSNRLNHIPATGGQRSGSPAEPNGRLFHLRKGSSREDGGKPLNRESAPQNSTRRRSGIMRRITKRLQSPQREDDDDSVGELPIQRVPSLAVRRQASRISHRSHTSRVRSFRSSTHRISSPRLSRPISGTMQNGYSFSTRLTPTPSLRPPSALYAIGSALNQDQEDDSEYSTESEIEDAPITMRSVRLQRVRASTLTIGQALSSSSTSSPVEELPQPYVAPTTAPLTDLIEEITGELEGRPSHDSMDSALDFSLDHYCNAFPAPPAPGVAAGALFASSDNIRRALTPSPIPFAPSPSPEPNGDDNMARNFTASPLQIDDFTTSPEWSNWNFTNPSMSLTLMGGSSTTSISRNLEGIDRDNAPSPIESRHTPTRVVHQQNPSTTSSGLSSTPATPATPSFAIARPRSLDPLAQARRKTRIISGQVVDGVDDDSVVIEDTARHPISGRSSPLWWDASAGLMVTPALSERRGSDKSSISSLLQTPDQDTPSETPPSAPFFDDVYSLNSPADEASNIGVALTTESQQFASPSPISFGDDQDSRLTLFARRKGRSLNSRPSKTQLRLEPIPPMPSVPENAVSTATSSYQSSPAPSIYEGTPSRRNTTEYVPPTPPPPSSAPSKRKSFFRYPFSSTRRSISAIKSSNNPLARSASPPMPSPRAVAPPMSANARDSTFPLNYSTGTSSNNSPAPSTTPQPIAFRPGTNRIVYRAS